MLIDALFLLALALTLLVVISVISHIWATVPYVPTQKKMIEEALALAGPKDGETMYDLGAGDGRVLREARRNVPGLRAIGYECVPSVWMWSRILSFVLRDGCSLRFGNLFKADLSDADIVFVYLFPKVMEKLETKCRNELRPGTRIVSHAFRFKDLKPSQEKVVHCGRRDRTLLLYVWPGDAKAESNP